MQLDGRYLYINDVLSLWLFPFKFNALNHNNQYSFIFYTPIPYKTQFPHDKNIFLRRDFSDAIPM
jgi:hypothetical protein